MPPARSFRSRKKQTQLQFQSISSSSPAKNIYSEAVHGRLANVTFQGAKPKQRPPADRSDDERSLPISQPNSPIAIHSQLAGPSSPLSSLRTSPAIPPRFTDINSPQASDDDEIIPPSLKRSRISRIGKDHTLGNTGSVPISSDPTDASSPSMKSMSSSPPKNTLSTPTRRSTRLLNQMPSTLRPGSSSSSQQFISVDIPLPAKSLSNLGSAESSDEDVMATQPVTRRRTLREQSPSKKRPSVIEDDEANSIFSHSDTPSRKRPAKRRRYADDFVVDNNEVEFITSDAETTSMAHTSNSARSSKQHRSATRSSTKRPNQRSKRERQELAEDLLDLQDSEQEKSARKSRTRGGPVTTQRDKAREHFDLLKRRRAGERPLRVITSDEDDDETEGDYHIANIDDIGNDTNRVVMLSDDERSPAEELDPAYIYVEDDDFVVDDEPATGGRLGRPNADIPLQFTSFASAKPRQMFPHIVEWMVKNKISPAFNRNDDVYKLSFSRIDDQVKAQAGSRLISSAWSAKFKYTILARPNLHVEGLDLDPPPACHACNKSNHPSRYDFTLSGKAYSQDTLEPIDDSDDDSDDEPGDDAEDNVSYDQDGHVLASTSMHFYLGKYCAANAEMGHKLTHWKYHLNKQVLSYLEEQGVLSAEAIVNRERLNKKRREKEAEHIVDTMQATGIIAELWQSFQDDLEDARVGMEGHEPKAGRSAARIGSVWRMPDRRESDSEGE